MPDIVWVNCDIGSIYDQYMKQGSPYTRVQFAKCGTCGATVTMTDRMQHENFHKTFTNRKDGNMSSVLWCDRGNHPFKAGSPGSSTFEGTMVTEDGRTESVTEDVCGEHNPLAIARRQAAERKAIEAELLKDYPTDVQEQ